jgi:flagellar hook assembly protein FlgD
LHGAFPNPFNPTTTLLFEMAVEGPARLEIFSVEGRRVLTLVDERLAVGQHERDWDGRDENGRALASGIYLARFTRPGMSEAKRLVLLK